MSKQGPEEEEDLFDRTLTYVYIPSENVYGSVIRHGVYTSVVEYHHDGVGYQVELENDEFDVIQEVPMGIIGHIEEEENL